MVRLPTTDTRGKGSLPSTFDYLLWQKRGVALLGLFIIGWAAPFCGLTARPRRPGTGSPNLPRGPWRG